MEGDSLRCEALLNETIVFLKDQPTPPGWRVYGSYFQEIENLEVKATVTEKGRSKEIKMPAVTKKREDDHSVFYDDSYFYPISIPGCKEGNHVSWSYKEVYRDPKFLPSYFFSSFLPMAKSTFTIKVGKGIVIAHEIFNDPNQSIKFSQYTKGSYTYYEWNAENFRSPNGEEDSPAPNYYLPHIAYYIKSYPTKNGSRKLLSDVDDLYKSYQLTVSGLDETPSSELDSVVHALINPSDKEIDIVKKIFYWVQDHIRYIAFEDGMRGLIPHTPNYIFEKRYGDCKDMASLIVGMLKVAGVKSYYTWIGTRNLPYKYSTLPTPLVDNHMIATYIDEQKKYYFLDATGNYTRLGLPSSMIQEKEALIALPFGYEVHVVPGIASSQNLRKDSVQVHIENKLLVGKGVARFTGYEKVNASYALDKTIEESKKDNIVSYLKKGNNKFYLDAYFISHLHEKDIPLAIDYQFRIGDYVNSVDNELYINLNLSKPLFNNFIPAGRKLPIENSHQMSYDDVYVFTIPEGYSVDHLPSGMTSEGKNIDYKISYSINGNSVILYRKISKHFLMLTPESFSDWNESIRNLSKAYKETILLKKSK